MGGKDSDKFRSSFGSASFKPNLTEHNMDARNMVYEMMSPIPRVYKVTNWLDNTDGPSMSEVASSSFTSSYDSSFVNPWTLRPYFVNPFANQPNGGK